MAQQTRRSSANGRAPVQKARPDMTELGSTGLKQFSGYVQEEFLRELQGLRGIKVYQEMSSNDPVVGAMLFSLDKLIRRVSWHVEAASEDSADRQAAEFVDECRQDMSSTWADTVSEVLSFLPFGWSWHEIVYKLRAGDSRDARRRSRYTDNKIGWRKLPIRAQDTLVNWEFGEDGGVQAMVQSPAPDFRRRVIPIEKSLLFRTGAAKGNPEGRSVLRNAYRPWYFKRRIEEIEGIGIERDLAGLPVAWGPPEMFSPSASAELKTVFNAFKDMVRNIRRDEQEGIVMPLAYDEGGNKVYDLTLLTTGGRRQFDTDAIVARYDQRIAMTVLADVILLGHENVGSKALAVSKAEMFATALEAFLDSIGEVFNRFAIPRLLAVNGMQVKDPPRLAHGEVDRVDLTELGNYVQQLAGAGAELFPDDQLENYLREQARLPQKTPVE